MANVVVALPAQFITRAEAARLAEQCARMLVEQFGAQRVIPFGSVVGESPWHSRSDIDLAVEGLDPQLYFQAWAALDGLLLPGHYIEIDLIELESAPLELRARILGEVKAPRDNRAALNFEIESKLKNLERVVAKVANGLEVIDEDEIRQNAIALWLHDFYNGVESIFERITVRLEGELPRGEHGPMALLNRMSETIPGVRPAVIDPSLQSRLVEFLKFRHRIRYTYSYELEWPKVKRLAEELDELMPRVHEALEAFEARLEPNRNE